MSSPIADREAQRRARMLALLAQGALFPAEVLGPLLDTFTEDRFAEELHAAGKDVRDQVRQLLTVYRPAEVPLFTFGRISDEEAARWQAEARRKYALLLRALGIDEPAAGGTA